MQLEGLALKSTTRYRVLLGEDIIKSRVSGAAMLDPEEIVALRGLYRAYK